MDSAKKLDDMTTETEAEMSDRERRSEPDGRRRDRRVIPRFTDPQMRSLARQIRAVTYVWNAVAIGYLVLLGALHATKGRAETVRSLFEGVVIICISVAVYRVGAAARSYIQNESVQRLTSLVERIYMLLFVLCVITAVAAGVHLVTLF